jgi:hypothetical protein
MSKASRLPVPLADSSGIFRVQATSNTHHPFGDHDPTAIRAGARQISDDSQRPAPRARCQDREQAIARGDCISSERSNDAK